MVGSQVRAAVFMNGRSGGGRLAFLPVDGLLGQWTSGWHRSFLVALPLMPRHRARLSGIPQS